MNSGWVFKRRNMDKCCGQKTVINNIKLIADKKY